MPQRTEPLPIVVSPWLSDVVTALQATADVSEHAAIVADVWQHVADEGTPIIEELPVDAGAAEATCIVTFIYRLESEQDHADVLLLAGWLFDADNPAATRLRRVPGTDIGHLSLLMPRDWRACYAYATVSADHDLSDPFMMRQLRMDGVADENARRFIPGAGEAGVRSMVELPDAPDQPWLTPRGPVVDLREGKVVDGAGHDRRLWLHAPDGPIEQVLVVLDGNKWAQSLPLMPSLDNLMADGAIPATATVFVESLDVAGRWVEFGCSDELLEFLAATVLPWVRERCDASAIGAGEVIVCGQSLGGLTALYAVLTRPDAFGGAIAQSPSLWWGPDAEPTEWLTARLSDGVLPAPGAGDSRIVLQYGIHEVVIAQSVERFLPVAASRGLPVAASQYTGGHDDAWWWGAIGQALLTLHRHHSLA